MKQKSRFKFLPWPVFEPRTSQSNDRERHHSTTAHPHWPNHLSYSYCALFTNFLLLLTQMGILSKVIMQVMINISASYLVLHYHCYLTFHGNLFSICCRELCYCRLSL